MLVTSSCCSIILRDSCKKRIVYIYTIQPEQEFFSHFAFDVVAISCVFRLVCLLLLAVNALIQKWVTKRYRQAQLDNNDNANIATARIFLQLLFNFFFFFLLPFCSLPTFENPLQKCNEHTHTHTYIRRKTKKKTENVVCIYNCLWNVWMALRCIRDGTERCTQKFIMKMQRLWNFLAARCSLTHKIHQTAKN